MPPTPPSMPTASTFTSSRRLTMALRRPIDLSSLNQGQTTAPYVVVLAKDGASPIPPESDDEKIKEEKKAEPDKSADDQKKSADEKKDQPKSADKDKDKDKEAAKDDKDKAKIVKVTIDLDNIGNRILSLPIPPRNYGDIHAGKDGVIYIEEGSPFGRSADEEDRGAPIRALWRFTLEKRKPEVVLADVSHIKLSADGSKLIYARHDNWAIAPADDLKPGNDNPGKPLNLGGMQTTIDPRSEWRQIYHETWRIERDFFYDPNIHGLSIPKIEARYKPYLDNLASRDEFTYLSTEMLGEITVGHMFVGGPGHHDTDQIGRA